MNISKKDKEKVIILYAEDDLVAAALLKTSLEKAGNFEVICAANGMEAWSLFSTRYIDVCLLDVHMPGLNGLLLGEKIRADNPIVPIMYISADRKKETKMQGYKFGGADDYYEKPVEIEELIAKMNALIRRARGQVDACKVIKLAEYTYRLKDYTIAYDDMVFSLGLNHVKILNKLIAQLNDTVTKSELRIIVFGFDNNSKLDHYISRLRKHFKSNGKVEILTIQGEGYSLCVSKDLVRYS